MQLENSLEAQAEVSESNAQGGVSESNAEGDFSERNATEAGTWPAEATPESVKEAGSPGDKREGGSAGSEGASSHHDLPNGKLQSEQAEATLGPISADEHPAGSSVQSHSTPPSPSAPVSKGQHCHTKNPVFSEAP